MAVCTYCGDPIDPRGAGTVYRRVVGWERKSKAASRKAGSDIVLREARDEFACDPCVRRLKRGVAATQEALI
jgi:hypothetical protein